MTLAETLLNRLSNSPRTGRHFVDISDESWSVRLMNDRTETLGSSIWELDLVRLGQAPEGTSLKGWANGIAERVTGLLEPLKVLELDEISQEAVLRSDGPTAKGDERFYYEVKLSGLQQASVRRYKGNRVSGGLREQQSFALTHEVLAKLVKDITG